MRIGNWPLFLLVLEYVIKHPDEYDQTQWRTDGTRCGTVRCIAGWAAYFAGYQEVHDGDRNDMVVDRLHNLMSTESAAVEALDFAEAYVSEMADHLFEGNLTFDDVLGYVRDLARTDGVTPTPLVVAEMRTRGVITEKEWI
jgi:hypothetical protein